MENLPSVAPCSALAPDRNPILVYLSGLAPSGRASMGDRIKQVAALLGHAPEVIPWHEIRHAHLVAIRTKLLEQGYAPATVNACLYAVRGVARAAFNLGVMSAEDYERLANVKAVKYERLPAGRAVQGGELAALMKACANGSNKGRRDAALIALLYSAGLRRAEIVALDLASYSDGELRVLGKGNRERSIPITNGAAEALEDWIKLRGSDHGPLFCPIAKGGKIEARRMTTQAVYNTLVYRAKQAGVKHCSPHDLRRSCTTDLLEATNGDVLTVQKLLGHAHTQTTARYDRRGEQAKRRAVGMLHVPYCKAV